MESSTVFIFFSLLVFCHARSCDFPPHRWCTSQEIAEQCKVTTQCQEYWSAPATPVKVDLYYESLCPFCKFFIRDQLYPVWQQLKDIVDITVVPYGNAKESWNGHSWVYTCQHGPDECFGNVIETCVMHMMGDSLDKFFPFIYCLESNNNTKPGQVETVTKQCAEKGGLSFTDIMTCAKGPTGNSLEHAMGQKTGALNPPHHFVPYILINGVHSNETQHAAQHDLKKLVCDTYQGTKPPACKSPVPMVCQRY